MNLIVQGGKNFTLSERMRGYIERKIEKINYFKQHIKEIDFHLDKEKLNFIVNATIITHKFGNYQFSVADLEMYSAIDKIMHKIDVKINREKSKIKDHSKATHEELVEFFNHHDEDKPEPTTVVELDGKPTQIDDAYLQMKDAIHDFHCFTLVDDLSPAFFRKLEDDIVYLFKKENDSEYSEFSMKIEDNKPVVGEKVRTIDLEKHSLLSAQKKILDQDYHFDLFINASDNKISFLFKENNGKWVLMA